LGLDEPALLLLVVISWEEPFAVLIEQVALAKEVQEGGLYSEQREQVEVFFEEQ